METAHHEGTKGSVSEQSLGRRWGPFFPFSIGAYLSATLWLQRTGVVRVDSLVIDLLGSCLMVSLVSALGWWVASRFTADVARRALVGLIAGLWSLLYGSYFVFAAVAFGAEWGVLAIWTGLLLIIAVIVVKSSVELGGVRRALDVAGFVLLAFTVPPIVRALPSSPEPTPWTDARAGEGPGLPDLYIIVPDKFSGTAFLAREYGVDHTATEDSLRALGFVIPLDARANYAHTRLALTTFLEGAYVKLPENSASTLQYDELPARIQGSPLWAELRSHGYRVVFFPTTFSATSDATGVDLMLTADRPADASFAATWMFHSPLSSVETLSCQFIECEESKPTPFPVEPIAANEWKLHTLSTLPDSGGPIAAFLHLLSPHEPYLYADDCSARDAWWPSADEESGSAAELRLAYAAQVRCLDKLLLETVTELLARSKQLKEKPVIIIQSDHGRGRVTNDVLRGISMEMNEIAGPQLAERFSLFAAYRFPGADTLMYDGITPVNVMPTLRHVLFGAPLQRHADRSFWSPYQRALDLTEITPARLRELAGSPPRPLGSH